MKQFSMMILFLITSSLAGGAELDVLRLSDCESLDGWQSGGGVQLIKDAHQGEFAVSAVMPAGKVGALRLNYAGTGIDLSKAQSLKFWWKAEGDGLRSFMVKIRNHPIAGGMEAVYRVWDKGKLPEGWRRASINLSKPLYDDWGGKPDLKARYISLRTTTSANADVRLFVDEVIALPKTLQWQVSYSVSKANKLTVVAKNLTNEKLSVNFGNGGRVLKQMDLPPEDEVSFDLELNSVAPQFSQLQPYEMLPLNIWAEITDLGETRMYEKVNVIKKGE